MRILKFGVVVLIFLTLNSSQCAKDSEETLPDETQTGADTFGCKVDGDVWVPYGFVEFPNPTYSVRLFNESFFIEARKSGGEYCSLNIFSKPNVGLYALNNQSYAIFGKKITNCYYHTDSITTGVLQITKLDTLKHIISGYFYFKGGKFSISGYPLNNSCDSFISITEGRFDLNYFNI